MILDVVGEFAFEQLPGARLRRPRSARLRQMRVASAFGQCVRGQSKASRRPRGRRPSPACSKTSRPMTTKDERPKLPELPRVEWSIPILLSRNKTPHNEQGSAQKIVGQRVACFTSV